MTDMNRTFAGWVRLLLLAALAAAIPLLMQTVLKPVLPKNLGGLKLVRQMEGAEARALVDRIHEKGVGTAENYVGFYRSPVGTATLYVTVYGTAEEARKDFGKMGNRIEAGNGVFTDFRWIEYGGLPMCLCSGMDQLHYFFVHDRSLYWIAVDPPHSGNAVWELLNRL
jgi:hypothetical protein